MKEESIQIQMLGGFRVGLGENFIEESSKRAPKFWKVLQYLITFRHKQIPHDELVSAIWPDAGQSDPRNVMHNMIFRIRSTLASSGVPHGKEMILYNGGGYAWNNSLNCVVDCEEFEKLYNMASADGLSVEAKLELLLKAIELYKGEFLPKSSYEMWVIPLSGYYRSMYIKCVHTALELIMASKDYNQAETLCKKALQIDPFDEKIIEYHLRALIKQDNQTAAMAEYHKTSTLFYEELGIDLPMAIKELYLEIESISNVKEHAIEDLMKEWHEKADYPGAYYCEYIVFRSIYQLEARSVARTGKLVFIISLSFNGENSANHKPVDIMTHLYDAIRSSLRKGDIFTRAAPNQYILMLQALTYENCSMIIKRITRKHKKKHANLDLTVKIRPINPVK